MGTKVYEPANQQDFKDKTEVYIELGDDWDINDIEAIWLDENEKLEKPVIVTKKINGVEKRFAVFSLNHFSTYLLIVRGNF